MRYYMNIYENRRLGFQFNGNWHITRFYADKASNYECEIEPGTRLIGRIVASYPGIHTTCSDFIRRW